MRISALLLLIIVSLSPIIAQQYDEERYGNVKAYTPELAKLNVEISQKIAAAKLDEAIVTIAFTYTPEYQKLKTELETIDELYNYRNKDREPLINEPDAYIFTAETYGAFKTCNGCKGKDLIKVQQMTIYNKQLDAIFTKYSSYWKSFEAKKNKKEPTEALYRHCVLGLAQFKDRFLNYDSDQIVSEMDQQIKYINETVDNCKGYDPSNPDKGEMGKVVGYRIAGCDQFLSNVKDARRSIALWNEYAKMKGPTGKNVGDIQELYAIGTAKINSALQTFLAQAKCPVDAYAGADKEALKNEIKKQWLESFPQTTVLKIKITSPSWSKKISAIRTGSGHNASAQLFDESKLDIAVIISDPNSNDIARVYPGMLTKDNLNKGSGYFSSCGLYGLESDYTEMLSKNVK